MEQIVTDYIDTYVSSPSLELLQEFLADYPVYIPARQGRSAQEAETDSATGEVCEATNAAGDPNLYYACVRMPINSAICVSEPLSIVDVQMGEAVLGVFL